MDNNHPNDEEVRDLLTKYTIEDLNEFYNLLDKFSILGMKTGHAVFQTGVIGNVKHVRSLVGNELKKRHSES